MQWWQGASRAQRSRNPYIVVAKQAMIRFAPERLAERRCHGPLTQGQPAQDAVGAVSRCNVRTVRRR